MRPVTVRDTDPHIIDRPKAVHRTRATVTPRSTESYLGRSATGDPWHGYSVARS